MFKINDEVVYTGLFKDLQDRKGKVLAFHGTNPHNIKVDIEKGEVVVVFPSYTNDFAYVIPYNELKKIPVS